MRYLILMLVALLAGCGDGGDTRYFAAFLTTETAEALAAARANKAKAAQPVTASAATRGTAPAADAFQAQVRGVVATPSEGAEPEVVSAAPASAPENSEPMPL